MKKNYLFVILLWLGACAPQASETALPPTTLVPTRTAQPTATLTPEPTRTPPPSATIEPSITPSSTTPPTASDTPSPTLSPTPTSLSAIGPFLMVEPVEGQPLARIYDLRVAPDGILWLVNSDGVWTFAGDVWTPHPFGGDSVLLGFDGQGRTWLISGEGETISVWDGVEWRTYGPEEGWTPLGVGIFTVEPYNNVSEGIVSDKRGWVWLATRVDVRAFDGQVWTVYDPEQVGFIPTEDMIEIGFGFSFTDVAVDSVGDVWVSDCAWMGPGPIGQGARWYNGVVWQGAESQAVGSGCIQDVEVDPQGRIWIPVNGDLWRYTPGKGWIYYPHPDFDLGELVRWGWIADLDLVGGESALVSMSPCGGASCESGDIYLFHVHDGVWTLISEQGLNDLAFDSRGDGWLCIGEGLYHLAAGDIEPVLVQDGLYCSVEVDPEDRFWLMVIRQPYLWLYDPAVQE